jgi:signal transduction histidine kinase
LLAGAVLLAITYGLVAHDTSTVAARGLMVARPPGAPAAVPVPPAPASGGKGSSFVYRARVGGPPAALRAYAGQVAVTFKQVTAAQAAQLRSLGAKANARIAQEHSAQMSALLTKSGIALAIMAVLSIGLGWLMAGRALRPLRTMSARAKGISERNLHARLAIEGPDDELKDLGDTFDGLLARLESAFESQRRFVANASHELRTPITFERTLVEVALADPAASVASLRDTCRRVLRAGEQQERLIEALLTLARSQRGLQRRENIDLAAIVAEAARGVPRDPIRVELELEEAWSTGDPALVERLVGNLLENALHYNRAGGWVCASTGVRAGLPTLEVSNTGPVIDPGEVQSLLEPFHRRDEGRSGGAPRGLGLGLSIVAAIADAHSAGLTVLARSEGGLTVRVGFQAAAVPEVQAMSCTSSTLTADGTAQRCVADPGSAHR